ncbi:MAG: hypothetical protein EXR77_00760 [Myxococcales bacterium]|nr:hypothetical protein [Myxococcales bacterium]
MHQPDHTAAAPTSADSRPVPLIPPIAHFVWLGPQLPDLGWLAIASAQRRGGFSSVRLWCEPAVLKIDNSMNALRDAGLQLHDLADLDRAASTQTDELRLRHLCATLPSPAARADVWRLRIVRAHGGVYLDSDAIVLRSFAPLFSFSSFVGLEYVALPAALYASKNPLRWARAAALLAVRHAIALRQGAGQRFAKVAAHFHLSCNNAVFGAEIAAPMVQALCAAAAQLPAEQASRLYELGPRLWERQTGNRSTPATTALPCEVLPPHAFYPLGPEICADYVAHDPHAELGDVPDPLAYAAHLYDSVVQRRLGRRVDLAWLQAHTRTTLLGRMVADLVPDLASARGR